MRFLKNSVMVFLLLFSQYTKAFSTMQLQGKVIDAQTARPLQGAIIYISDLKISSTTNQEGNFILKNLPNKGSFVFEVRMLGYKTELFTVDLDSNQTLLFKLTERIIEAEEVIITGTPFGSQSKTSSLAVAVLRRSDLTSSASTNLIEAIAKLPGVSNVSTGASIGKPVIRGLGYNRVLTMIDGVREEGQQWGDEHGVLADQNAIARVEVLKGPASLLYGSDALGGVINIIDDLMPQTGQFNGDFNVNYQTNNGLIASSLMGQGNQNDLIFRTRVSYKNAYGFATPNRVVPNSGYDELAASGTIGLRRKWGYSNFTLSNLKTNIGLVEDGPDIQGIFIDDDGSIISNGEARRRILHLPMQKINHLRLASSSNFLIANGQLKTIFAFQQNLRSEYEEDLNIPGLDLCLNSFTYDVKYALPEKNNWERTIGFQGMTQQNINKGNEFLIPDYSSHTVGAFIYLKKNLKKLSINSGLRYDYKMINGTNLITEEKGVLHQYFTAFDNHFSNFSSSLGVAYSVSKVLSLKANIGSGFRAPNIAELASNGKHEGTFRYEIGQSQLKQETSLQYDLGINLGLKNISFGLNLYQNNIYRYIFLRQFNQEEIAVTNRDGVGEILPVYRYTQTNAKLNGGEFSMDYHFVKNLHFESTFALVNGINQTDKKALPFIPATNWNNEIRYEPSLKGLEQSYLKIGLNHFFQQDRISDFETITQGYSLVDAGIGCQINSPKRKYNLWISGQNLTNVKYYNHLSRYKLAGIYNPGRNIALGVQMSF